MIRRAALLALLAWGGTARAQQPVVILRDSATGSRLLAAALAGPYRLVVPSQEPYVVARDSVVPGPLVVLGRDVVVDGAIEGDVFVVNGALYTHPGARVVGNVVTFGGGIYESALATIVGGRVSIRDFTYDVRPMREGYVLTYRRVIVPAPSRLNWIGPIGFRVPTYDRTNGLSIPISPTFTIPALATDIEPSVTYRSQLGQWDAAGTVSATFRPAFTLRLDGGRSTATNESWIHPDFVNSIGALLEGDDIRNYYRATRVAGSLSYRWNVGPGYVEPFIAGRWERATTVRPDSFALGGPWSLFGRDDIDDMLRPNPPVDDGDISSLLVGAAFQWKGSAVGAAVNAGVELGGTSEMASLAEASNFAQATLDGRVTVRTFGAQRLRIDAHAVLTTPGTTPRQRWAYLGGPGTLITLPPLEQGGDELVYLSGSYDYPLTQLQLPLVGPPTLTLRSVLGSAGVRALPALEQGIGGRVSLSYFYGELLVDPVTRHGASIIGISLTR